MSEHLGITVLRAVGRHYRAHPESWTTGYGNLSDKLQANASYEWRPGDLGCIDTMIRYFGARLVGTAGINQAVEVLCEHHGLAAKREAIWVVNDEQLKSAEDAIAFVEAPFSGNGRIKIPAMARHVELVATLLVGVFAAVPLL